MPTTLSSKVLVCFAVRQEARFFSLPLNALGRVEVLITGMGKENAAASLERALSRGGVDLVLTCGFAGGLRPDLAVGDLVYSADAGSWLSHRLAELGAIPAVFHCSARIAITARQKSELRAKSGADAVEMESAVIHQVCQSRAIRSATLRVISDSADQDLPLDFNRLLTGRMEIDYVKLAWALARAPARVPALLRLNRGTTRAARRLGWALRELLRQAI